MDQPQRSGGHHRISHLWSRSMRRRGSIGLRSVVSVRPRPDDAGTETALLEPDDQMARVELATASSVSRRT
jgi:hypothetical protein